MASVRGCVWSLKAKQKNHSAGSDPVDGSIGEGGGDAARVRVRCRPKGPGC